MKPNWEDPYVIIWSGGRGNYTLDTSKRREVPRQWNTHHFKGTIHESNWYVSHKTQKVEQMGHSREQQPHLLQNIGQIGYSGEQLISPNGPLSLTYILQDVGQNMPLKRAIDTSPTSRRPNMLLSLTRPLQDIGQTYHSREKSTRF